eukprot:TRINITY_DN2727_c1_g2_i2.p1 TRINITY_DN2727_c1_g2~~TRINITY_DN2727_c1_g2_i2.p1  ORF type:complete len:549 (-),score=229.68 TRINITY_DN2727_c1_g2_i2:205-1851(-)
MSEEKKIEVEKDEKQIKALTPIEYLKRLGHNTVKKDGNPLLFSFVARLITLEKSDLDIEKKPLTEDQEKQLIQLVFDRCSLQNDPIFETVRMQVTFESLYSHELQKLGSKYLHEDQDTKVAINKIVEIASTLQTNQQVANLYRAIFKLLLTNSGVEKAKIDRTVEHEIAVALESVFPQAGLNAFNMLSAEEKKRQLSELVTIVLGIRLFNRHVSKRGAGLVDVPVLSSEEVDSLYELLEVESTEMGDVCYAYADVVNLEYDRPGTIHASLSRLQDELTNRRQYVLFIHQLQHEVLDSMDIIKEGRNRINEALDPLKALVGLRSSVPKEQVYPKFHQLASTWNALSRERAKNTVRKALLKELWEFKDNFQASLLEDDLQLVKQYLPLDKKRVDPDSFVKTLRMEDLQREHETLQQIQQSIGQLQNTKIELEQQLSSSTTTTTTSTTTTSSSSSSTSSLSSSSSSSSSSLSSSSSAASCSSSSCSCSSSSSVLSSSASCSSSSSVSCSPSLSLSSSVSLSSASSSSFSSSTSCSACTCLSTSSSSSSCKS